MDFGAWKPGEKSSTKYTMAVRFYELAIDGDTVHKIDMPNMVREIDGVDALAEQRAALGI